MHLDVDSVAAPAFGLVDTLAPGAGEWHSHRRHQLLFVSDGAVRLELAGARWVLPPARAAWIAAGTAHRIDVSAPAALRTIYLDPELGSVSASCAVFGVGPLAREMILQGAAWGPTEVARPERVALADAFYRALAAFVAVWIGETLPYVLPRASSANLRRVTEHLLDHLDAPVDASQLARLGAMSPRTLTRAFHAEMGTTLRAWLHQARMLHAMEQLSQPGASVTDAALAVGYSSLPTFSRQFAAFAGETPSAWRLRVASAGAAPRTRPGARRPA